MMACIAKAPNIPPLQMDSKPAAGTIFTNFVAP
jgi:hypothetical protein